VMGNFFSRMLEQADSVAHSRSSVLVPLQWLFVIFMVFFIALILVKAPTWAIVGCGFCLFLLFLVAIAAYIYFGLRSPDALRSEQYSLSKYAMERGLYGDSDSGMVEGRPVFISKFPEAPKLQMDAGGQD